MKTKTTVTKGAPVRTWHLVDANDKVLGRISVEIANKLMGKNKVDFSPNRDAGDYVVVINAKNVRVTGNKLRDKVYYHHTAFAGHLKEYTLGQLMQSDPRKVIHHGVLGMLPKNKLRHVRMTRLKVFVGSEHPYNDKINH